MSNQRKTAADFGQLSLFAETIPEWLQPENQNQPPTHPLPENGTFAATSAIEEDDELGQFTAWLQQGKQSAAS